MIGISKKLITDKREKSVSSYLEDIKNTEPLTREEEWELAQGIKEGDEKSLHKLIECNLKYVVSEAKKYQTARIPFSEILQQGNIGAVVAAKRFDPDKGFKFITYLKPWVKQSILHYVAEYGRKLRLPSNQNILKNNISKHKEVYYQYNGYYPTNEDIATHLEVSVDKVDFIEGQLKYVVSMDKGLNYDTSFNLSDIIPNENSLNPSQKLMDESLSENVSRVLSKLSQRDRDVIKMENGIGYDTTYPLEAIAEKYGLTKERIRQISSDSKKEMKKLFLDNDMDIDYDY